MFIQDIIDRQGNILSKQEVSTKYNIICRPFEWESLKSALPNSWKRKLRENKTLNLNYHVFKDCNIRLGETNKRIDEISTK
jgi:hypothetical protein